MHGLHGNRYGAFAFLMLVALTAVVASARGAQGAPPAWPLSGAASATCAFGASYRSADGKTATHRGLDLAAEAGEDVLSPLSGEVRFVGRVPASAGGTQLAITIAGADGVSVTLMPLDEASVSAGENVCTGTRVAGLANEGDASSDATHLHVGARRGDLYIDPMTLLVPPVAASVAPAEPEPAPQPVAPVAQAAPAPEPVPDPAPAAAPTPAPAAAPTPAPALVPASAPGPTPVTALHASPEVAAGSATAAEVSVMPVSVLTPAASAPAFAAPVSAAAAAGDAAAASGADRPFSWLPSADPAAVRAVAGRPRVGAPTGMRAPTAAAMSSAARKLLRAWSITLLAALVAAAALWPLWRRRSHEGEDESRCCIAPEGTQVAAAAGR